MNKHFKDQSGNSIIVFIISIAVLIWIGYKIYDWYTNGEKKPFWTGTSIVQVCKKPYYSSGDCYKLKVSLLDEKTAKINFENGGYVTVSDVTCYFAAKSDNEPRWTFCRSWDRDGNQWDLLPNWINY